MHSFCFAQTCPQAFTPPAEALNGSDAEPNTLSSFAHSITTGLILREEHIQLFELYKKQFFGLSNYSSFGHSLRYVLQFLEDRPELSKIPIREQILEFSIKEEKKSIKLTQLINQFKNSALKRKHRLFRIRANWGFWANMLSFPEISLTSNLNPDEKKDLKENYKAEFFSYLSPWLDKDILKFIAQPSSFDDYKNKVKILYHALNSLRDSFLKTGQNVNHISQAVFTVVDTAGFGNRLYMELVNSKNISEKLEGLRLILSERDTIAYELGFTEGFKELQQSLNIKNDILEKQFMNIEKYYSIDHSLSSNSAEKTETLRLRPLSLYESPFRSCLSGDCATSTYFYTALDPNYLYFTLTDKGRKSSGHITVILGNAESPGGQKIKTAWIDKIQNIPNNRLILILEGMRRSLKEQGYTLGVPKTMGGVHNGLSNSQSTKLYVKSKILPALNTVLKSFTPHPHDYSFKEGYSRAYKNLDMLEFDSTLLTDKINIAVITPGPIHLPKTAGKDLSAKNLYSYVLSLKDSPKEEEQINFLDQLPNILAGVKAGVMPGVEINSLSNSAVNEYLKSKIQDQKASFNLRKKALYIFIHLYMTYTSFKSYLPIQVNETFNILEQQIGFFSNQERKNIFGEMSNWKNTHLNNYKKKFIDYIQYTLFMSDIDKIKYLLESPEWSLLLNVSSARFEGHTALSFALDNKEQKKAELFLEHGADIDAVGQHPYNYDMTLLSTASQAGSEPKVQLLINLGANINETDIFGKTAIMYAFENDRKNIVKILQKKRAGVNPKQAN